MTEPTKPCKYCLRNMELSDDKKTWECLCGNREPNEPTTAEYRAKFGED